MRHIQNKLHLYVMQNIPVLPNEKAQQGVMEDCNSPRKNNTTPYKMPESKQYSRDTSSSCRSRIKPIDHKGMRWLKQQSAKEGKAFSNSNLTFRPEQMPSKPWKSSIRNLDDYRTNHESGNFIDKRKTSDCHA